MHSEEKDETATFIAGDLDQLEPEKKGQDEGREQWSRKMDFVLSLIGYAVGVGNLWRFPYLCLRNGGGAFLIPFFTFLLLAGIPLFYLEVCLGQFSGTSSLFVWKLCPLFKGVGYGMVIVSGMACIYYNAVITWVIYYLVNSFRSELPWSRCGHWWNTPTCIDTRMTGSSHNSTDRLTFNTSLVTANCTTNTVCNVTDAQGFYGSNYSLLNNSIFNMTEERGKTAAEEFWQYNVLRKSSGFEDLGSLQWHSALCLLAAWVLVVLCLFRGVKSLGKVVYVTALLPYVLLTIFLIRGSMLPGALDGIKFYVTPDFSKLKNFNVWIEACIQVFYSLGPAWGGLITMSSFNKFDNNCFRDAVIATLADGMTSFYGGFVIFAVIGYMAKESNLPITEVATQGPGLAMVAYPEAITRLPLPQIWAVLFFFMLLLLGLDSQFGMFETLVSGILDAFPNKLRKKRLLVTSSLAAISYLVALPIATNGGIYVFQLLDWFVAAFCVLLTSFLECIIIGWIYGVERFGRDIEMMLGRPPSLLMKLCWCFVTPVLMLVALIFTIYTYKMPTYDGYIYPVYARGIGFVISVLPVIPIPVFMVWELVKAKGSFIQRLKSTLRPGPDWGPARKEHMDEYRRRAGEYNAIPLTTRVVNTFSRSV
ncbi:sodium- and chloride-dependent glycine transporter 1-like isoform X2 [Haliotis rubra]|nr:sodium- and chloride-dependent glycine transporter 1-like isoform X2 [Haliotis rubra]